MVYVVTGLELLQTLLLADIMWMLRGTYKNKPAGDGARTGTAERQRHSLVKRAHRRILERWRETGGDSR